MPFNGGSMKTTLRFNAYTEDEVRSLEAYLKRSDLFSSKGEKLVSSSKPFYELEFGRRTFVLITDVSCLESVTERFTGILNDTFGNKFFMVH